MDQHTIMNILPRPSEKPHIGISFSGPLVTDAGDNTRRTIKNPAVVYEPTSPRVSCMGNVKCRYTKDKLRLAGTKLPPAGKLSRLPESSKGENKTKKMMGFMKLFGDLMVPGCGGRKPVAGKLNGGVPMYLDKAPSLSTMKRFSSGRDKLSDHIDNDNESDEEVIVVPSSAPVMIRNIPVGFDVRGVVGCTEPRKEINLWKRRTMQQPKPLLLNNNNNNNNI